MKHWIACPLVLSAWLLAGCDSVNHAQFHVVPPKVERGMTATIVTADREAVKRIVSEVAVRWRFEDRTAISLTPDTLCSFAQPDVKYPISVKAWMAGDRISVDIQQPPPEVGETAVYQRFRNEVISGLEKHFGERVKQVQKMNQTTARTGKR
jgi:hypothetical protein